MNIHTSSVTHHPSKGYGAAQPWCYAWHAHAVLGSLDSCCCCCHSSSNRSCNSNSICRPLFRATTAPERREQRGGPREVQGELSAYCGRAHALGINAGRTGACLIASSWMIDNLALCMVALVVCNMMGKITSLEPGMKLQSQCRQYQHFV